MRVKILFHKKDNALIQMSEPQQAQLGKFIEESSAITLFFNHLLFLPLDRYSNDLP